MDRCILCYRCTYVGDQLTDERKHGIINRGDHAEISTYIEKNIDNEFSGNMIDVCPVGALTDKTARFEVEFGLQIQWMHIEIVHRVLVKLFCG